MKRVTKLTAFLLALVLALGCSVNAFASGVEDSSAGLSVVEAESSEQPAAEEPEPAGETAAADTAEAPSAGAEEATQTADTTSEDAQSDEADSAEETAEPEPEAETTFFDELMAAESYEAIFQLMNENADACYELTADELAQLEEKVSAMEDDGYQGDVLDNIAYLLESDGQSASTYASSNMECDIKNYKASSLVYWDTMSYTSEAKHSANHAACGNITSVSLNGIDVKNANSGALGWAGGTTLSTYFPDATTSTDQTVTLTITPAAGYYVTHVCIACAKGDNNGGLPHSCQTWSQGGAFDKGFTFSTTGAISISVSAKDFSHSSRAGNYFILIQVAPIPSPLYVEYDYGDIVTFIGDGNYSAFNTADGWTTASGENVYCPAGTEGSGIETAYTQFKYWYDTTLDSASAAAAAAQWKHVTNTISRDALNQAAAAGYYFDRWKYTYYTTVTTEDTEGSYNNYNYAFSADIGTGSIGTGENLTLLTNVRLVAQWKPIEITVTKTVTGLPGSNQEYTFQLQKQDANGSTWQNVGSAFTLTVNGSGTATATISALGTGSLKYAVTPGTYRVVETNADSNVDVDGTTYYCTTSYAPENGSITAEGIINGTERTLALGVTNAYTNAPPATTVTITKQVTGNMGDTSKEFSFTVTCNSELGEATDKEYTLSDDGKTANFTLSNKQSVTLNGVKKGSTLTISEQYSGYDMTVKVGETTLNADSNGKYSYTIPKDGSEIQITVTNEKNVIIDTGILLDTAPYVLILAAAGAGFLLVRRRRNGRG